MYVGQKIAINNVIHLIFNVDQALPRLSKVIEPLSAKREVSKFTFSEYRIKLLI